MTRGFKSSRGGRVTVKLSTVELRVLDDVFTQVAELVAPPQTSDADPLAVALGLEELDSSVDVTEMGRIGHDPVIDRLFPPGYEDEEQATEFRRFTELGLRRQKESNARTVLDSLGEGGKITLDREQAQAWLMSLNDARLALATRLGIESEADHERLRELADTDERAVSYAVYDFLTYLQDSLVGAMSR